MQVAVVHRFCPPQKAFNVGHICDQIAQRLIKLQVMCVCACVYARACMHVYLCVCTYVCVPMRVWAVLLSIFLLHLSGF